MWKEAIRGLAFKWLTNAVIEDNSDTNRSVYQKCMEKAAKYLAAFFTHTGTAGIPLHMCADDSGNPVTLPKRFNPTTGKFEETTDARFFRLPTEWLDLILRGLGKLAKDENEKAVYTVCMLDITEIISGLCEDHRMILDETTGILYCAKCGAERLSEEALGKMFDGPKKQ